MSNEIEEIGDGGEGFGKIISDPAEVMIREMADASDGCTDEELVRIAVANSDKSTSECAMVLVGLKTSGIAIEGGGKWAGRWWLAPWFVNGVRGDWFGLMDGDPADPHLPPWVAPEWGCTETGCSSRSIVIGSER